MSLEVDLDEANISVNIEIQIETINLQTNPWVKILYLSNNVTNILILLILSPLPENNPNPSTDFTDFFV